MSTLCSLVVFFLASAISPQEPHELTWARFESLHREIQPAADEPWRSVPWKIDLLEAQREAAQQKRPLFVWSMDGHPLGCT